MENITEQQEQDALNQFYTLIFMTNPMTNYLKIWIASENMILYMKQSKFINLIGDLLGFEFKNRVEYACMEYGGFYFIDRQKKEIRSLSMTASDQRITPKEMFDAAMKENPWINPNSSTEVFTKNKLFDQVAKPILKKYF